MSQLTVCWHVFSHVRNFFYILACSDVAASLAARFKKYSFLPNDDPYRHYTQPICYTGTTRICVQNFAAERRAVSELR